MSTGPDAVVAHLGLGTNLGDRQGNLARTVSALEKSDGLQVLRSSSIFETAPWGVTDQPSFLNMVVEVSSRLSPQELLVCVKGLEQELGREPGPRYGPRLIDVDILLYGQTVVDELDLHIPHASLHLRAFVLVPLAQLAPDAVHPVLGRTVKDLADDAEDLEGVHPLA